MTEERKVIEELYRAVGMMNSVYDDWARQHDMSANELQIFAAFWRNGAAPLTQKELSEKVRAPKTTVNSIIKKYIARGLIEPAGSPCGKKEKPLRLTAAGEDMKDRLLNGMLAIEESFVTGDNTEEIKRATALQARFASYLRDRLFPHDDDTKD